MTRNKLGRIEYVVEECDMILQSDWSATIVVLAQ